MNYNTSVEELLHQFLRCDGMTGDEWDEFVAALRKAVIREASVGKVYVARDDTDGCPEFRFRCAESLTGLSGGDVCQLCRELIPERKYLLIPSNLIPKEAR